MSLVDFLNAGVPQKSPAVFGKGPIGDSIGSIVSFPGGSGRLTKVREKSAITAFSAASQDRERSS